jgi:uncharacterized membrane protein
MEDIKSIFLVIAEVVDFIGVVILLFGFIKILFKYIRTEFKNILNTPIRLLQKIRCELGIYILLALDFLIASDIIQTITELSQEQLIELSVMILLRTAIGFFLGKEVDEIESKSVKIEK